MPRLVNGNTLFETLRTAAIEDTPVRLAIAFWGKDAVRRLELNRCRDIEIVCNLGMGGTNPHEIRVLVEQGAKVYALDTLHAKMGVFGQTGFVGSSNASANGLAMQGEEMAHWDELNVVFTDSATNAQLRCEFEAYKAKAGNPLSQKDQRIDDAIEVWNARRRDMTGPPRKKSLLDSMKKNPSELQDSQIYVVMYDKMTDAKERKEFDKEKSEVQKRGKYYDCYWGWPNLPRNAWLIDFEVGPKGGVNFTGFFRRSSDVQDHKNGEFQVCVRVEKISGFSEPSLPERKVWENLVRNVWKKRSKDDDFYQCIDVCDFARNMEN